MLPFKRWILVFPMLIIITLASTATYNYFKPRESIELANAINTADRTEIYRDNMTRQELIKSFGKNTPGFEKTKRAMSKLNRWGEV